MTTLALPLLLAALLAQAAPTPTPSPMPAGIIYFGKPASRMTLVARPLGFDPDGNARWLVVTRFLDAQGDVTRIMANSDLDYLSRDGYVQWQTRLRYGQPAAILKTHRDGPMSMTIRANIPKLGSVTVRTDTRMWRGPRVVAQVLGPHMIQIGWFPQENTLARVVRIDSLGRRAIMSVIAGPSSTYRDTSVMPGQRYRYVLYRANRAPIKLAPVAALPAPPATAVAAASGKAMWLFFTANPIDPLYYKHLDPQGIVDQAVRAGLHYIELRTAYGAYWEITPEAKPTIDAIIDGLAAHGIGTIGWTVPRDTTFEDLQASVRTAYYRTAKGTPFTGLALDLERGDEFMGGDPQKLNALWLYMQYLREAFGPRYLLVATVEDPYLEHLDNTKYPFRQIANFSDVLQPMAYWRMMRRTPTTPAQVKVLLQASYDKLLAQSGRKLPVSIGGQTTAEGRNGYPPAGEITASLDASKQAGAIGECFFDWSGTQPFQWDALASYRW
jgi:hypothetical protein